MNNVIMWKGKPAKDLTKEVLVETLEYCYRKMEDYKKREHDRQMSFLSEISKVS